MRWHFSSRNRRLSPLEPSRRRTPFELVRRAGSLLGVTLTLAMGLSGCAGHYARVDRPEPLASKNVWQRYTSERFDVLSDLDSDQAREVLYSFEELAQTLDGLLQQRLGDALRPAVKIRLVVLRSRQEFEEVSPGAASRTFAAYATRRLPLELEDVPTIVTYGEMTQEVRAKFVHQWVHQRISRTFVDAPIWLNEGLAVYFERAVDLDGNFSMSHLSLVAPDSWDVSSRGDTKLRGLSQLRMSQLVEPSRLVHVSPAAFCERSAQRADQPDAEVRCEAHYASAFAFVRLLLDGPAPYPALFGEIVRTTRRGESTQEAFEQAFAATSQHDVDAAFFTQLAVANDHAFMAAVPRRAGLTQVQAQLLGSAEVHALLANLEAANGGNLAVARRWLAGAPCPQGRCAAVSQAQGVLALIDGATGLAKAHFELALAADPKSVEAALGLVLATRLEVGAQKTNAQELEAATARLSVGATLPAQLNALAVVHAEAGRLDQALALAEEAVKTGPECAYCMDTLAQVLDAKGEKERSALLHQSAARIRNQSTTAEDPRLFAGSRRQAPWLF